MSWSKWSNWVQSRKWWCNKGRTELWQLIYFPFYGRDSRNNTPPDMSSAHQWIHFQQITFHFSFFPLRFSHHPNTVKSDQGYQSSHQIYKSDEQSPNIQPKTHLRKPQRKRSVEKEREKADQEKATDQELFDKMCYIFCNGVKRKQKRLLSLSRVY